MTKYWEAVEELLDKRQFFMTSIAGEDVSRKLLKAMKIIEKNLSENCHLSTYSFENLHRIVFVFIINNNNFFKESMSFSSKKKELSLELKVDYQSFLKADEQEALQLLAQRFLEAIHLYPSIRGMKKIQFDTEKFYQDVKQLFEKQGFLQTEVA